MSANYTDNDETKHVMRMMLRIDVIGCRLSNREIGAIGTLLICL